MTAAATPAPVRARRRETEITFLRLVPGDSFVHRLWAGTKLLVAAELALVASLQPTWFTLGVIGAIVLMGLLVAGIPLGAFPRLPRWFYALLVLGLGVQTLATT